MDRDRREVWEGMLRRLRGEALLAERAVEEAEARSRVLAQEERALSQSLADAALRASEAQAYALDAAARAPAADALTTLVAALEAELARALADLEHRVEAERLSARRRELRNEQLRAEVEREAASSGERLALLAAQEEALLRELAQREREQAETAAKAEDSMLQYAKQLFQVC